MKSAPTTNRSVNRPSESIAFLLMGRLQSSPITFWTPDRAVICCLICGRERRGQQEQWCARYAAVLTDARRALKYVFQDSDQRGSYFESASRSNVSFQVTGLWLSAETSSGILSYRVVSCARLSE